MRLQPACLPFLLLAPLAFAAEPTLTIPLGQGVDLELILLKKGKFQQGAPADEPGRGDDETLRAVTLSQDFYLGKYPVTRGQFARFVQETGYRTEAEKGPSGGFGWDGSKLDQRKEFTWRNPGFAQTDQHPVTIVTYADALAFCGWLSKKAKRSVALPTEAQWEYACRAGTSSRFHNGAKDEDVGDIAWHKANAGNGTRPVGQKKANDFGLFDMAGNVYEWCRDWHGPYAIGPAVDPEEKRSNLSNPARRVLRGGSWLKDARHCRSAARYRNAPGSRNADNGFRVLAAAEPDKAAAQPAPGPGPVVQPQPLPRAPDDFPQPVPHEHSSPRAAVSGMGICCFVVFAGLVILAVVTILRRFGGSVRSAGPEQQFVKAPQAASVPGNVQIRLGNDGFWVLAPAVTRGSFLRYRCRAGGAEQSGSVPYEPGPEGQFVYTGATPADVKILDVLPPEGLPPDVITGSSFGPSIGGPHISTTPRSSMPPPSRSKGYPSAY